MSENDELMPSLLDRQISSTDQDAFGHRHFAIALKSIIESEKHKPPYSIGLLGGWGTGKSTIKELYINDLQDDARKNKRNLRRSDRIRVITFNAWRFGGKEQDIKRALLRHVYLELGGDEESLQDYLFRQISHPTEVAKSWWRFLLEQLKAWALPLPAFLIALGLLFGFLWITLRYIPFENDLARTIIGAAIVWSYTYLLNQIKSPPVSAYNPVTKVTLPSTTAEQFEDLLLKQISKFKSGKSSKNFNNKGPKCERLVVFVDDLDRLSAEEMVLGIDAVRTFMEIPSSRLPDDFGLVFVISCDESKVADALANGRHQGDIPGTIISHADARRYLDRIFQFRLEIPPFPRQDMRAYAVKKLKELPGIEADLNARKVPIETVVDRMIHVDVQDPRNALQIVNTYSQSWWLAKKREVEEVTSSRPGGLHEGAVTGFPEALGALSALKVDFPDFYRDLQDDPSLLQRMSDVIVRGKPIKDQPLSTQQLLVEKYLKRQDENSDPKSKSGVEVLPQYRPLRQFLASLIGLRWPESLQSLLLLSEDPISRKFGSKTLSIFNSFVSGDTEGVLEGLGRHIDSDQLKANEASLLYQMAEELRHQTYIRRMNASRVIADLIDRIPLNTTQLLLGSLCRELSDSLDLRSQIGVHKISKILSHALPDDQKTIVSRLIEDVITINEDVHLQLQSLEPPSLDEAVDFARTIVPLALETREKFGLDVSADKQLLKWLIERTIRIGGKQYQISFKEFEEWMANHEENLLSSMSNDYTDLLGSELEDGIEFEFDVSSAISRARKVFDHLYSSGEETRRYLWENLIQYIALQTPEAPKAAWEVMISHLNTPNATYISRFMKNFVQRLHDESEYEDSNLDISSATNALLTIVKTRYADLDNSTIDELANLAIVWSKDEHTSTYSCSLTNELRLDERNQAQQIFDNWSQRILDDLPSPCISLLASVFSELSPSAQKATISNLQFIISNDAIDENKWDKYADYVKSVPDSDWDSGQLKTHLDNLLPQVAARHNNPNNYLRKIFPIVAPVMCHASKNIFGSMLHNLFAQTKSQPQIYAWLHSIMVDVWPHPLPELHPYNPNQIFQEACDFALTQPKFSDDGLLRSLRHLVDREIVTADKRSALIEAACSIWSAEPSQALETFMSGYDDLTIDQIVKLFDRMDWNNAEHISLITQVLTKVVQKHDTESRVEITDSILKIGVQNSQNIPDIALHTWFNIQEDCTKELLTSSILQTAHTDEEKMRLWQQAIRLSTVLGSDFFLNTIPQLIVMESMEQTTSAIFKEFELISNLLGTMEKQADLSNRLMLAFSKAPTNTIKSKIAEWCKKFNGQASLMTLNGSELTDGDLDILESTFPRSAAIRKLQKAKGKSKLEDV